MEGTFQGVTLWSDRSTITLYPRYGTGWIEIRLEDLDSYQHPTVYCNYDCNEIMAKFKKITIDVIYTPNSVSSLIYDTAEPLDVQDLYQQYLARLHNFTYSRKTIADYGNSLLLAETSKGLPDQDTFLTKYNIPLWIDLSATRSYTRKPDTPNAVITSQINFNSRWPLRRVTCYA